ncbi:hypothetical protein MTR67_005256 [Solanum verrucosum]|uniref:4-hydroxy-tetrahydrodipicolinate reductase n=1 Tax=Solanum verrucosum TaxID=315347 RepID=A0AAF0TAX8_SOLVR|nr:hypothetical protein MTR67_005256 [Solanum verrucosum]
MWAVIKVPVYINGGGIRYSSSSKNGCNSFVRGRKYSVKMCSTPGQNVQVSVKSKIEPLPIMVNGCNGKMGRAVLEASIAAGLQPVPICFGGPEDGGKTVEAGGKEIIVHGPSDRENILSSVFEEHPNLIVVDYTLPAAVNDNAELYCKVGVPFVMGTTGGDREKLYKTVADSKVYAVISPQMGKQVVAFLAAMEIMAEQFPGAFSGYSLQTTELDFLCDWAIRTAERDKLNHQLFAYVIDPVGHWMLFFNLDRCAIKMAVSHSIMSSLAAVPFTSGVSVMESHQASKLDTSGTAKAVISCFEKLGVSFDLDEVQLIRDPVQQVEMVGVPEEYLLGHAFHMYHLTSPDGTVSFEFQHNVCGRSIYAEGTVDAILFLAKKVKLKEEKRIYDMIDVLREGNMR